MSHDTAPDEASTDEDRIDFPAPRAKEDPFAPPPGLLRAHADGRSIRRTRIWDGSEPWLITGHALQRTVMSDERLSANPGEPGYPHTTAAMKAHGRVAPSVNNTDGAEHSRFRRALTKSFTRKRMATLRPAIQQITEGLIDDMLAGPSPVDLHERFSLVLPSLMICELLGVPYGDHGYFQEHAAATNATDLTPDEAAHARDELRAYIRGLIESRLDDPQENLLSDLAVAVRAGDLTMDEAVPLGHILLVAGHDTSANMITLGTALLLEHPDQLELLRQNADDPAFVANAVEELLRYLTIPHLLARRAVVADMEIEGQVVRAGEGIIASLPAANWDPEAFPDADRLDLTRKASHHHAFGWGPHQCIGQQLARIELEVVFATLFVKVPTLRLAAELSDLSFKEDSQAYGIYSMPVAW